MSEGKISQEMIDEAAGNFVVTALKHFETQRRQAGYEAIWKRAEESYFSGSQSLYNGLAKVRIPFLHNKTEVIVPKLDKVIFPPDGNWLGVEPDNELDEVQKGEAEIATMLLKDQTRDIGIRTKYIGMYRSDCIYGTVIAKTLWEHKIKKRYKRVDGKRVEDWQVVFDNPNTYSPSIWDFYVDIKDEDMEGLVIERIVKDYQDLWNLRERKEDGETVGIYRNVRTLREVKDRTSDPREEESKKTSETIQGLNNHEYGEHEHKIVILECWGAIPLWFLTGSAKDREEKQTTEGLIVVALKGEKKTPTILRISDNPFDHQEKPYQRARYIKINGRFYGIGLFEPNLPMEAELNTLRNQNMDMRTFNLRPKWLRDTSARISDESLKNLSEQIIDTNDINGLQPLRPNDFSGSAIAAEQNIKADLAENTGGTPILSGMAGGNSIERTASGVSALNSSALDRFDLVVTNFEEELISPMMKQFWALNQQFLPEGRALRVIGKELIRVMPQEIPLPKINFIGIQENAEKQFRINSANILIQNLSPFAQNGLDPVPLVLEQVRLLGWGRLIPEIDKRPDSVEQMEQTPEGEVQLLLLGRTVKIDFDDDHDAFIAAYDRLLQSPDLSGIVRRNTENAKGQRLAAKTMKNNPEALKNIKESRRTFGEIGATR